MKKSRTIAFPFEGEGGAVGDDEGDKTPLTKRNSSKIFTETIVTDFSALGKGKSEGFSGKSVSGAKISVSPLAFSRGKWYNKDIKTKKRRIHL